jgi:hypothetical protein
MCFRSSALFFYTMWAAHWHCVIHEATWSSTWVFNWLSTSFWLVGLLMSLLV